MNMQLPKHEQKVLEAALTSTEVRQPSSWMPILGLVSGVLIIVGGAGEYLEGGRGGLRAIGYGGVFICYLWLVYEHLKFRNAAFSLIKKLQSQRANGS